MNKSFVLRLMGKFTKPRSARNFRGTLYHYMEKHILFFRTSWKDGLSKTFALEYDIPCIVGKDYISVFRKYILPLGRKMKDELFQQNTWKYDIFFRCFERWSFQKDHTGTWDFLYYLERWYLFLRKHNIFSLDRKWKMIFLKKYSEARYFLPTCRR